MKLTRPLSFLTLLSLTQLYALPEVANELPASVFSASVEGNMHLITSGNPTIDWKSFSIGAQESVHFHQPSESAYVMNRVIGGQESQLLGKLISNGGVYLLNPNGIYIGPGAQIDVSHFVGSTFDLFSQVDGSMLFKGSSSAPIVNLGKIGARSGDVYLFARQVKNEGIIEAKNGTVGLAATTELLVKPEGKERIFIAVPTSKEELPQEKGCALENSGKIESAKTELRAAHNLYELAIKNTGSISSMSIKEENGEIYITAQGGRIENSGKITGQKAHVEILAKDVILLDGTSIDLSSEKGGGTLLVGGDQKGTSPHIPRAKVVYMSKNSQIKADGLENSGGGKVVLWGDDAAIFYGNISAKGGVKGGDGGFVDLSSPAFVVPEGKVDTLAPKGKTGTFLIDPTDIIISNSPDLRIRIDPINNVFGPGSASIDNPNLTSFLNVDSLKNALNTTSITVASASSGSMNGDITIQDSIDWNALPNALTITASGSSATIKIEKSITALNTTAVSTSPIITLNAPHIVIGNSTQTEPVTISTASGKIVINAEDDCVISSGNALNAISSVVSAGDLAITTDQLSLIGGTNNAAILSSITPPVITAKDILIQGGTDVMIKNIPWDSSPYVIEANANGFISISSAMMQSLLTNSNLTLSACLTSPGVLSVLNPTTFNSSKTLTLSSIYKIDIQKSLSQAGSGGLNVLSPVIVVGDPAQTAATTLSTGMGGLTLNRPLETPTSSPRSITINGGDLASSPSSITSTGSIAINTSSFNLNGGLQSAAIISAPSAPSFLVDSFFINSGSDLTIVSAPIPSAPYTLEASGTVSAATISNAQVSALLNGSNVNLTSKRGVTSNADINWSNAAGSRSLSLIAPISVNVNANIQHTDNGDGNIYLSAPTITVGSNAQTSQLKIETSSGQILFNSPSSTTPVSVSLLGAPLSHISLIQAHNGPITIQTKDLLVSGAGLIADGQLGINLSGDFKLDGTISASSLSSGGALTLTAKKCNLTAGAGQAFIETMNRQSGTYNVSEMTLVASPTSKAIITGDGALSITTKGDLTIKGDNSPALFEMTGSSSITLNVGGDTLLSGPTANSALISSANGIHLTGAKALNLQSGGALANSNKDITLILGTDALLSSGSSIRQTSGDTITVVVDDAHRPVMGPGKLQIDTGALISTASGKVKLFTVIPRQNLISSAQPINGVLFAPSPDQVNTGQEQWDSFYPNSFFQGPGFVLFYKALSQSALVTAGHANTFQFFYNNHLFHRNMDAVGKYRESYRKKPGKKNKKGDLSSYDLF